MAYGFYTTLIRPLLFSLPPETAHAVTLETAQMLMDYPGGKALLQTLFASPPHPALTQTLWGTSFSSPLGLAAGADKNGHYIAVMRALGLGYEEIGSLTRLPWPGNPKPRVFRLPQDEAVINRMGLNNGGIQSALPILQSLPTDFPIGISLSKTPDPATIDTAALEDFAAAYEAVYGLGTYVSLNISCPNTTEGKTFETPESLDMLLKRLFEINAHLAAKGPARPILLKLSPDISPPQLNELFDLACRYPIAGWIVSNTTSSRAHLKTPLAKINAFGNGGLSGRPLQAPSTAMLAQLHLLCRQHAPHMVLIGVGGIHSVESAWEKITHGASLLQLYTGLIYQGPGLIKHIQAGLVQKLSAEGLTHVSQAVGIALIP